MIKQLPLLLVGLTGLASASAADVLHLEKGGRIEGVLLRETASTVTIDVGMGQVSIPRTAVARVERKQSPLGEFRTRRADLDPKDVGAHAALARFASQSGLGSESRQMWARVLVLDPGNVEAHLALGHVLLGETFVEEAEAFRARGLVNFDGRWMTPAEQSSLLRERERRAADDGRLEEARRAARNAEDQARRARAEAAQARAAAASTSSGYPIWGLGGGVIVSSPYFGGYSAGCSGASCYTVPQIWAAPTPPPRATPAPRAVPIRPSSVR